VKEYRAPVSFPSISLLPICSTPRIRQVLTQQSGIQQKEIIQKIGSPQRTVARCIAELVSEAKIEHRGSKKTGGYFLKASKKI
jgi:hypothetical protein